MTTHTNDSQLINGDRVCWTRSYSEAGHDNSLFEGTVQRVLGTFVEVATDGYDGAVYGVTTGQIVLITPAGDQ
jgi:hypothetical protein